MDKVTKLLLIARSETRDTLNQIRSVETCRKVFCTVKSVTRAEFVAASQKSLSPSAVVSVFFADYQGETIAELDGKRYEIYRTYRPDDYIELYLGTKVGV